MYVGVPPELTYPSSWWTTWYATPPEHAYAGAGRTLPGAAAQLNALNLKES